jgi:urocanate hydratase
VPHWATQANFDALEKQGLIMFGQMTAGSWIYIGTQGILQGTYETFAEIARQHFGGSLRGRLVLTAGLGGMGGAQPLAITMNEGVALVVEVDPARIHRRRSTGWLDAATDNVDEALRLAVDYARKGEARSIALLGNAADVFPELVRRGLQVDVVTDQTSAHDPLDGYIPLGVAAEEAPDLRRTDPDGYVARSRVSMARHCEAMVALMRRGAVVFDYGNNLRAEAQQGGFADRLRIGVRPGIPPTAICGGRGPFRGWRRATRRIVKTTRVSGSLDERCTAGSPRAATRAVPGLPAHCWLGYGSATRRAAPTDGRARILPRRS